MKLLFASTCLLVLIFAAGCSITPEKPVSRQELYRTNVFSEFTIKDSPESVLATLNRDGEVVLEGKSRFGDEFFIKILATISGLKIRLYAK
jgi:midasin (ATPase involved in ribosome maturation)